MVKTPFFNNLFIQIHYLIEKYSAITTNASLICLKIPSFTLLNKKKECIWYQVKIKPNVVSVIFVCIREILKSSSRALVFDFRLSRAAFHLTDQAISIEAVSDAWLLREHRWSPSPDDIRFILEMYSYELAKVLTIGMKNYSELLALVMILFGLSFR